MALENEGPLTEELTGLVGGVAQVVAVVTAGVLGLALLGEVLRRRGRAHRVVALVDRVVPRRARAVAVSLVALAATVAPARPLAADESLRGWLGRSTPSTSRPAVVTPHAVDALPSAPAPAPHGPMVLTPEGTGTDSRASAPVAPSPPPPSPTRPAVPAPPEPVVYTVVVGDCLWSIAARHLGADPDASAVDAGWRAIYAANRDAVGDDPGLIHPGLVLRLPPLAPPP
jgi:nucleoid-associated protein YgaU